MELFFNYPPCKLCIYQRIPYFFLIVLSIFSFFNQSKVIFYYLAGLIILTNLSISSFHSLVERKIVNYDSGCTSKINDFDDIDELRNFLETVPITKCDEISFSVFGFSLANINVIISILLISITFYILLKNEKKI
tara:strand:+ start:84 stop:488 length:405 start_codon:yes stop_codon:yes gene_type:complete